ncbi:MAG: rhomboid family intramembrane serine protease, partial [Akkermansia sp.]|nr:rhomboid family intramembrane serine protease [Akkermansia sp.]
VTTIVNNVSSAPMLGASGAVFGLLLAFAMMFPDMKLQIIFIPIGIKAKYFVLIYGLAELFFGVNNFSGDNIAHWAHLGPLLPWRNHVHVLGYPRPHGGEAIPGQLHRLCG